MQTDGNLVVYDASGTAAWASNTAGNSGSWLNVQDDGNVVIYRTNGTAAWDTNTVQPPCTTPPPPPPPPPPTPTPRTGDANCDGTVNPVDAALILQFGGGLAPSLPCQENADVNGDGQVNSIDDALILQYVAGYTTSPGGPVVAPPQPTPTPTPPTNVFTLQCDGFKMPGFSCYEMIGRTVGSGDLDCDWSGRFFDCKLSASGESASLQCWPSGNGRLACGTWVSFSVHEVAFVCSGYLPLPGFTLTCWVP
jgi:hypothetical protein